MLTNRNNRQILKVFVLVAVAWLNPENGHATFFLPLGEETACTLDDIDMAAKCTCTSNGIS